MAAPAEANNGEDGGSTCRSEPRGLWVAALAEANNGEDGGSTNDGGWVGGVAHWYGWLGILRNRNVRKPTLSLRLHHNSIDPPQRLHHNSMSIPIVMCAVCVCGM